MRHVKKDYEKCADRYQSTMAKIGQTVATSTARPPAQPVSLSSANDMQQQQQQHQHHHHHQHHQHHNHTSKSAEDAEQERLRTVCCAFQQYVQCSEFTVRHACGDETAMFTRKFLDRMSNNLMRMHCVNYTPESGKCRDYFSSRSTRAQAEGISSLLLLLVVATLSLLVGRTFHSGVLI